MGKALEDNPSVTEEEHGSHLDWRKRMSDNVAFALIVYTGLQIFVTVGALKQGFSSLFPYIALIILVAAIIPACRWFERRWLPMSDEAASDESYRGAFRRDQLMLWLLAIGLPFVLTALLKTLFAAA
ncbi:hypothetical protein [Qipengyuania marisflavi]|uniref:Uncharacterized protein n=1 Tax=Qipengyuania marisflavi TaxID=2486356 RepID=A0A5S3PSS9_9SPHN|nr:hypothetical protein [Qipengyuania marisflavi]TMM46616.1 hypothetical protein FEV51_11310 [Qipengyuania marisflavi]